MLLERDIWFCVIWGEFTCVWNSLKKCVFIKEIRFVNMKLLTILRFLLWIGDFGLKIKKLVLWIKLLSFSLLPEESDDFSLNTYIILSIWW